MFKSRWKWLLAFLAAEAFAGYVAGAVLLCTSLKELLRMPRHLFDLDYALFAAPTVLCLLALQLAFLTPVAFPILKRDPRPGWARLLLSGFAITLMVLAPPVYAGAVISNFFSFEMPTEFLKEAIKDRPQVTLAVAMVLVGPIVTLVLRRKWSAGVPVRQSIWIAGMVCGVLVAGFVMLVFSAYETFDPMSRDMPSDAARAVLLAMPLVSWLIATPLLVRFAKRHPGDTALDKLASRLLMGTIIETAAIIPFDVLARRRDSCYCLESSFFALIAAGSAGLIMLGPAIFLVVGRRRAKWMSSRCPVCEYDMSGFPHALRCPECGAGWKSEPAGTRAP
ncbi:MAG: hypothetical protein ACOYN0_01880 [Phycisphaerales bacterium]